MYVRQSLQDNPFYLDGEDGIIYSTDQKVYFYNENIKNISFIIDNKMRIFSREFGYKFGYAYIFSIGEWGFFYDHVINYNFCLYKFSLFENFLIFFLITISF